MENGRISVIISEFSPVHLKGLGAQPEELLSMLHSAGRYEVSTLGMGIIVEEGAYVNFTVEHEERGATLVARRKRP